MLSDLRFAFRQLAINPGFTAVSVLTLALGIGACTSVFSVVNSVLLRPLDYPESGRLIVVQETKLPQIPKFPVAPGNFSDWRKQSTSFENLAAMRFGSVSITGIKTPVTVIGVQVTANYLATLRVRPLLGRDFTAEDAATKANVALLSHGFWLRQFDGRPGVINETVRINDDMYTIAGVLPENFDRSDRGEIGLSADIMTLGTSVFGSQNHEVHILQVFGRLNSGVTLERARSEMDLISGRLAKEYPKTNNGWGVMLTPMLESTVGDVQPMLYSLLGAVSFTLLIACANVANLLLARSTVRSREIVMRVALGASRGRIVRQLLSESVLLALIGGALGVLVAKWSLDALLAFAPESLPRVHDVAIDGRVLGFACLLALGTGVGFGLVPAFQASRVNLSESLKDGGRANSAGGRRRRLRSILVVAEVAVAMVLLVGSGLLIRSFVLLQKVDPGFRPDGAIGVSFVLPDAKYGNAADRTTFVDQVSGRIAMLHGVESVGATSILPFSLGATTAGFAMDGQPEGAFPSNQETNVFVVTPGFSKALGLKVLRGRFFNDGDRDGAPRVAVINETFAKRYFPGTDPMGRRINLQFFPGGFGEIVGVVGDVKTDQLDDPAQVQTYEPFAQMPQWFVTIVVRAPGALREMPAALRGAVYSVDKDQPVWSVRTVEERVSTSMARQRFAMFIFSVFSCVALLLATIGIYGVMAYSVEQRTWEIGIRMALGAQRANVLSLVFLQGSHLIALGLACGVAGALLLTRLISSMLFGVSPQDPLTFAAISVLLATVTAAACLVPALRATKVDPVVALRAE